MQTHYKDIVICIDKETDEPIGIPYKDRFLNMLILGPTGCCKTSQVLIPMINQDIQNGRGVTVIEPKGMLAEEVYEIAKQNEREVIYFNPIMPNCPYFNPLYGEEDEVIKNMVTSFKLLHLYLPQYFQDMNEILIKNSLKVLKRLKGNKSTLIDLSALINNTQDKGRVMINQFAELKSTTIETANEDKKIITWFLSDYFNESSKIYEYCGDFRTQISNITSNRYLGRVLNPLNGENDVNFEKIIEEEKVLIISTARGDLRRLGSFLDYLLILNLQSAIKKENNEETISLQARKSHFLYIDEFQCYSNPEFVDILIQGDSYNVASHLATQNRALVGMNINGEKDKFIELVSTNAKNVIIFPGANAKDAEYYSNKFGNNITPFDIRYRPFGEITYRIIKDNIIKSPGVGKALNL